MSDPLRDLIVELREVLSSTRNLVFLIAVPAFFAGLIGATIGGVIAGSALELRTARGLERFHQARTLLAANGITLEQGIGDLRAVLVIQRRELIASDNGTCPPRYPRSAYCIRLEKEAAR